MADFDKPESTERPEPTREDSASKISYYYDTRNGDRYSIRSDPEFAGEMLGLTIAGTPRW
jgi:hypothetical protein